MGRIVTAISVGRRAVAQADLRMTIGRTGRVQALLAPGLSNAALARALTVFGRLVGPAANAVLICDRIPITGLKDYGFEQLVQMPDLLSSAPQASVLEHQVRRLHIILARRSVGECHWTGNEAADLVRLMWRRRAERAPAPVLMSEEERDLAKEAGQGEETIFLSLQLLN